MPFQKLAIFVISETYQQYLRAYTESGLVFLCKHIVYEYALK